MIALSRILRRGSGEAGERGATAVEVAIIFPLFLTLVFGLMWFGIGVSAKVGLGRAAREGARHLAITGDVAEAEQVALDAGGVVHADDVTFTSTACPDPAAEDDRAVMTMSYPFEYTIPMVGTRTVTLTSSSVAKCR